MKIDAVDVKVAIYGYFADTGSRPDVGVIADRIGADRVEVLHAYQQLVQQRLLVLDNDGESIIMAPPFSGVPTQHTVVSRGQNYFANCAWDALGIAAALQAPVVVHSRCEASLEPLELPVGIDGPAFSPWL